MSQQKHTKIATFSHGPVINDGLSTEQSTFGLSAPTLKTTLDMFFFQVLAVLLHSVLHGFVPEQKPHVPSLSSLPGILPELIHHVDMEFA